MALALTYVMLLIFIHMKVSPAKRQELSQTITSLLDSIKSEKGCRRCDFLYTMQDKNILGLLQEWDSQKHFEKYCQSESFKVLRGAMNLLEEPSEIVCYSNFNQTEKRKRNRPSLFEQT